MVAWLWENKGTLNFVVCTDREIKQTNKKHYNLAEIWLILKSVCLLTDKMGSRNKQNSRVLDILDITQAKQKSLV